MDSGKLFTIDANQRGETNKYNEKSINNNNNDNLMWYFIYKWGNISKFVY